MVNTCPLNRTIVGVRQSVKVDMVFPKTEVFDTEHVLQTDSMNYLRMHTRLIPEVIYSMVLPSYTHGYYTLHREELYDNACRQNKKQFKSAIYKSVERYKRENNTNVVEYTIQFSELWTDREVFYNV